MIAMKQISETDLKTISKLIIEYTDSNSNEFGGWFKAFPVKFDEEFFDFDFRNEKDIVALIFLATIWNMPNYKWENAIGLIGILYNRNLLSVVDWSSRSFMDNLDKNLLEKQMNHLDENLHKRGQLYIKGGDDGVFERLYIISCGFEYLRNVLKLDDVLNGHRPHLDHTIFDMMNDEKLKIEGKGRNGKMIKKSLLKVKIPLILRELKCANSIDIDDRYCCVPDSRVKKMMKIIGYPLDGGAGINSVIKNSGIISKYFGNHYDLPLFDFAEYCPQKSCKGDSCKIFNYCGKNIM